MSKTKTNQSLERPDSDGKSFEKLMAEFVFIEPFYAYIASHMKKYEVTSIPTAGVCVEDGYFTMKYNSKFTSTLLAVQFWELMKHEIMHIVLGHCTDRPLTKDPNLFYLANIAWDLAINSLLNELFLPPCGIIPGKLAVLTAEEKKLFDKHPKELETILEFNKLIASFPKEKSSEWYWERLRKNPAALKMADMRKESKIKLKMAGPGEKGMSKEELIDKIMGGIDEHDGFSEGMSKEDRDVLKEDVRDMIEKAIEQAEVDGWGSIPGKTQTKLRKLASRQVDWKAILKTFVGMARSVHKTTTMKRVNKRYAYVHPGTKRRRTARIAIAVDQSGSVRNSEIQLFFAELQSLAQWVDFEVIPFDSVVREDKIFQWKRGQKLEVKRVACGGTDFNVPTRYVNERTDHYDAMIIFTDGECSKPISCKRRRLYLIPPGRKLAFSTNEQVLQMTKMAS